MVLEVVAAPGAKASGESAGVGNCPISGGKGILMRVVRAVSGDVEANRGDCYRFLSPKTLTKARPRGSGRSVVNGGDAVVSVENGSHRPSITLTK